MAKLMAQEEFIRRASEIHNSFYNYSKTVYKNIRSKVRITCPIHGEFEQSAKSHLMLKQGCKKCGYIISGKSHSVTTNHFIESARKVHGDKYEYSKVKFENYQDKITITCKKHGDFTQRLSKHLYDKQGCRKCVIEEENWFDFTRSRWIEITKEGAYLYLAEFLSSNEKFYKIGITKNINSRFHCKGLKEYKIKIIDSLFLQEDTGAIWDLEKKLHKLNKSLKYKPINKFDGSTECFQYISEIISSFKNNIEWHSQNLPS